MKNLSKLIVPKRWPKVSSAQTVMIANKVIHERNIFNGSGKKEICQVIIKRYNDAGDKDELMLFVRTMDQIQMIQSVANDSCKATINNMGSMS